MLERDSGCRLNRGGILFKRTRTSYQQGSLQPEERKKGPAVWIFRWRETAGSGKTILRKQQIGTLEKYPSESAAWAATDALRLTINDETRRKCLPRTVNELWQHYLSEEWPLKEITTQDTYSANVRTWILPRYGSKRLEEIHTPEVEKWLREVNRANGTKAKIRNVFSALYSHAVRWGFCTYNPISSGIPVGTGGRRGPSIGVRVSSKRQKEPLVLSPEEVKLGLAEMQFRDQLLVFLDGSLGARRGELGALRWMDCDFTQAVFRIRHSYYWRRGGHLKDTKTEGSAKDLPMHPALKDALFEWRTQSRYIGPTDFVFPSTRKKGRKPLDLAAVLKRKIRPAFAKHGIEGVGWHTFRHSVGSMLAEMGEHQLTIRDYLRHSNLSVTNKYLRATAQSARSAQERLVGAIVPNGLPPANKPTLIQ